MTANAREVLQAFHALPPDEKRQVVTEMLRSSANDGELSPVALDQLADELFCCYDAEEASDNSESAL